MTSTIASSLANSCRRVGDDLSLLYGSPSPLTVLSVAVAGADDGMKECLLFTLEDRTAPSSSSSFLSAVFQATPPTASSLVSFFYAQRARSASDNSTVASRHDRSNATENNKASLMAVEVVQSFYIDLKHTFVLDVFCCVRDGNCFIARFTYLHNTATATAAATAEHKSYPGGSTSSGTGRDSASNAVAFHSLFWLPLIHLLSPVFYRPQETIPNVAIALHPWSAKGKKKMCTKREKHPGADAPVPPQLKVRIAIPFFIEAIIFAELQLHLDVNHLDLSAHPIYKTTAVGCLPFLLNQDSNHTSYGANYYTKKLFFLPHHFDFYDRHPLLVLLHQYQMGGQAQRAGAAGSSSSSSSDNNHNNSPLSAAAAFVFPRDVVNVCVLEEQQRTLMAAAAVPGEGSERACERITGTLSEGPFSLHELALSHASFLFTADTTLQKHTSPDDNAPPFRVASEAEALIGIFTRDPFDCFLSSPLCIDHTSTASHRAAPTTTATPATTDAEASSGAAPRTGRRDAYSFVLYNGEGEVAKAALGGPIAEATTLYHCSSHDTTDGETLLGALLVEVYDSAVAASGGSSNGGAAKTHFVLLEVVLPRTAGSTTRALSGGGFQVVSAMEEERKKKGCTVAIRSTALQLDVQQQQTSPSLAAVCTSLSGAYRRDAASNQRRIYLLSRVLSVEGTPPLGGEFHDRWYTVTLTSNNVNQSNSPNLYSGTQTALAALPDLRHTALARTIMRRLAGQHPPLYTNDDDNNTNRQAPRDHALLAALCGSPAAHASGALGVVWAATPHTDTTAARITTILLLRNGWFCARVQDPRGGVGAHDTTFTFLSQLPPLATLAAQLRATVSGALPEWMREALLLLLMSEPGDVRALALPFPLPDADGEGGRPEVRWIACCCVQQYIILLDVTKAEVLHLTRVTHPPTNVNGSVSGGDGPSDGLVPFRLGQILSEETTTTTTTTNSTSTTRSSSASRLLFLLSGVRFQRRKSAAAQGQEGTAAAALSLMEAQARDVAAVYVLFEIPTIQFTGPPAPAAGAPPLYVPPPAEVPPPFVCVCLHDVASVLFRPLADRSYMDCFRVRPFWFQLRHGCHCRSFFSFLRVSMDRIEWMGAAPRAPAARSGSAALPFIEQVEYLSLVAPAAASAAAAAMPQKDVLTLSQVWRALPGQSEEQTQSRTGYVSYMELLCTIDRGAPQQQAKLTDLFLMSVRTTSRTPSSNPGGASYFISCTYEDSHASDNGACLPPVLRWHVCAVAPPLYITAVRTSEAEAVLAAAAEEVHWTIAYAKTDAQEESSSGGGEGVLTVRPKELARILSSTTTTTTTTTEYVQYMKTSTFASIKL